METDGTFMADMLLPRLTLRNWFSGFLFIFHPFAPMQKNTKTTTTTTTTTCQGQSGDRCYHLIRGPRQNQQNNQPDLHNNNSNNKRGEGHGKNWL